MRLPNDKSACQSFCGVTHEEMIQRTDCMYLSNTLKRNRNAELFQWKNAILFKVLDRDNEFFSFQEMLKH